MAGVLTFLTDFGTADGYAAALVGAAWAVDASLQVTALTHDIPPGDVAAGSYWLAALAPAFPEGTVHCAVVDPGVGTGRALIAAEVDGQRVVCPDNGLLHHLWLRGHQRRAVHIATDRFRPTRLSHTFHGRDLMAPLAARMASGGLVLEELGATVAAPALLGGLHDRGDSAGTQAHVLVVDHFGNVILSVTRSAWYQPVPVAATLPSGRRVDAVVDTYGQIDGGCALLWNSVDHLEIAGRGASAAELTGARVGDRVRVEWEAGPAGGAALAAPPALAPEATAPGRP